jgi:hypothetical protein
MKRKLHIYLVVFLMSAGVVIVYANTYGGFGIFSEWRNFIVNAYIAASAFYFSFAFENLIRNPQKTET